MIVKSFNPKKWFFKTKYMSDDRIQEGLYDSLIDLKGATITLEKIFENRANLALNHWLGVLKITHNDGSYNQYLISTASDYNNAVHDIIKETIKILDYRDLDFGTNKVLFDVDNIPIIPKWRRK